MKKQENEALDSSGRLGDGYFMSMEETIRRKLEAAFSPQELAVEDFSAEHEGHSGHSPARCRNRSHQQGGYSAVARPRGTEATSPSSRVVCSTTDGGGAG